MRITDVQMFPVRAQVIPIEEGGIAPYKGSKDAGDGTSAATSALYKVSTDEGIVGWGEMNMIVSLAMTRVILNDILCPALIGRDPFQLNEIKTRIDSLYNPDINVLHFMSGVEMALWDIKGKATAQPVYKLLGGKVRDSAPIAYAMGIMADDRTRFKIEQIRSLGYRCIKTKGGTDLEQDIKRAFFMREIAGQGMDLRVDMNQGYSLESALVYLQAVEDCRLQYVEQPIRVRSPEGYRSLRMRSRVPIAINEDCYIPGEFFRAVMMNAVDVGVVDMESIGGISELIKLAHIAEAANVSLAHHCAWDMGIKTAAIVHAVCALEAFRLPMDSTYHAHAMDPLKEPLEICDGAYVLPERPGLGIEVDEEKVRCMTEENYTERYVF